jgi:type II secretory pathway pseudopilin PulG
MNTKSLHHGFTLIEVLIVMLVLVTIGSIILSIFVIALTGASKTRNQQIVRENGNFAISQISKQIQYAKQFKYVQVGDDTSGDQLTNCVGSSAEKYTAVSVTSFDDTDAVFACVNIPNGANTVATIASAGASLVNTNKVYVHDCYFTCKQDSIAEPPTIGIHLEIAPNATKKNPVLFEASIVPRNF